MALITNFDNQMSNERRTIFGTSYTKEELLDINKWVPPNLDTASRQLLRTMLVH